MVERPGIQVRATAAAAWSAEGPLAERALAYAHRFADGVRGGGAGGPLPPQHLTVEGAAPEHAGLGTGTQLGLAVGRALASALGLTLEGAELARRVGRGLRSALGVYGFEQGGLLVEAGKRTPERLAPLVARLPFPADWKLVLAVPRDAPGLHGSGEQEAFDRLTARSGVPGRRDVLCRLVLLGLLPAVVEHDLEAFGEALYEFNRRVGESFAPVQGGPYAGPRVAELVSFVRGQGVRGVGQSSWGPAVFAVVGGVEQAEDLAHRIRGRFGLDLSEAFATQACNHGAVVESA
jgi:beta-RFAP synthase